MAQTASSDVVSVELPFRSSTFEDGVVILDPVTGYLVTVAPFAYGILDFLKDRIEAGVVTRRPLLEALQTEMGEKVSDLTAKEPRDSGVQNLLSWVDLARHLYA